MGTRGKRWEGGRVFGVIRDSDWYYNMQRSEIEDFPGRSFSFNQENSVALGHPRDV